MKTAKCLDLAGPSTASQCRNPGTLCLQSPALLQLPRMESCRQQHYLGIIPWRIRSIHPVPCTGYRLSTENLLPCRPPPSCHTHTHARETRCALGLDDARRKLYKGPAKLSCHVPWYRVAWLHLRDCLVRRYDILRSTGTGYFVFGLILACLTDFFNFVCVSLNPPLPPPPEKPHFFSSVTHRLRWQSLRIAIPVFGIGQGSARTRSARHLILSLTHSLTYSLSLCFI